MKKYPCEMSQTGTCQYGGNKSYNYGFIRGAATYCRHEKRWVADMNVCPIAHNHRLANR